VSTFLVAVVSSAIGGVVGAYLQTRHERTERLRDRLLVAADDLATGLAQAILNVRHNLNALEDHLTMGARPTDEGSLAESRRTIDEAIARVARVELLYGIESPTAKSANATVVALRQAVDELHNAGVNLPQALDDAGERFREASTEYRKFSSEARSAAIALGRTRVPLIGPDR
jgi:hypothetical protein